MGGRRVAVLVTILLALVGCSVDDAQIERWKHTQRGPRKITTVLVEARYPTALRVHAARALIEMRHPNASGLDLLQAGMGSMAEADRETVVHALLPELQNMMTTAAPNPAGGSATQGPTDGQIRAKDAAYILLRGDGRNAFTNAEDRAALSAAVLDWILVDFNTRALAGAYTAEQIVQAVGPSAAERLTAAIQFTDNAIPVALQVSQLIKQVGTPAGRQGAAARVVEVASEVSSPQATDRLKASARARLQGANREITEQEVTRSAEFLRERYLVLLFQALQALEQPNGTEYLLRVAGTATAPVERRKNALAAVAGQMTSANVQALFAIATCEPQVPGPGVNVTCDLDLRNVAVDRLGETRDRSILPRLYQMFDAANGGARDNSFTLRWKLGEAILKLGGQGTLAEFMQHLSAPRPSGFAGYTFSELNGEAQALGDLTPPPRDALRAYVTPTNNVNVRVLAMLFLGIKGEARDVATLQQYASETATAVPGEGWGDFTPPLTNVGAVAARARDGLQNALRTAQSAAPAAQP